MKKLMTVGTALVLALTLGCKKEETPAAKPVEEAKPVEAAKPVEPTPTPAAVPAPAAESTGIPECDAYVATAAKFAACDKLPAEAKDAQLKGLEAAKATWVTAKDGTPEVKKSTAESCKASDDGLKTAWTAAGCQ